MPSTRIADIIVPETFGPYVQERTAETSILFSSGLVVTNSLITEKMAAGGKIIHLPLWTPLSGDDEVSSDDPDSDATPTKMTGAEQVAVILNRNGTWSSTDLAAMIAGDDPAGVVGNQVGDWWGLRLQAALISIMKGVFASSDMASVIHDISTDTSPGDANKIGGESVILAGGKLGDAADKLKIMAVHSTVYQRLQINDLIEYIPDSEGKPTIPTYQGKVLLQSDSMPTGLNGTETTYTTYLFGPGAVGFGEVPAKNPVEIDRDSLAADGGGVDFFIHRRSVCLHPLGMKWVGSPAGASPTNAELATGTNWARVMEQKNVAMTALVTNG